MLIGVSEVVLGSHPIGDPDRAGMGFTLTFFAGELASVPAPGELGADSADPALRRACLEAIRAATLNAGGAGRGSGPPGGATEPLPTIFRGPKLIGPGAPGAYSSAMRWRVVTVRQFLVVAFTPRAFSSQVPPSLVRP